MLSKFTMLGRTHRWQLPPSSEYSSPVQSTQVIATELVHSSFLMLGPEPGAHGVHCVSSSSTTFGNAHTWHSIPNCENVLPSQGMQADRSAFD